MNFPIYAELQAARELINQLRQQLLGSDCARLPQSLPRHLMPASTRSVEVEPRLSSKDVVGVGATSERGSGRSSQSRRNHSRGDRDIAKPDESSHSRAVQSSNSGEFNSSSASWSGVQRVTESTRSQPVIEPIRPAALAVVSAAAAAAAASARPELRERILSVLSSIEKSTGSGSVVSTPNNINGLQRLRERVAEENAKLRSRIEASSNSCSQAHE
jgi:hypothetical protein